MGPFKSFGWGGMRVTVLKEMAVTPMPPVKACGIAG